MKPTHLTLTLIAALLAGCTTYVEQPRERERRAYQPPPPRESYPVQETYRSDSYTPSPNDEQESYADIRTEDDFYEPLRAQGSWEVVGSYGRCWRPTRVERGWRPYCNGRWVRTEAGWYFASDEPWGWATYHYGRWTEDARIGWIWVPGVQWAPAWVSWHEGGGYVGWAPLPPTVHVRAEFIQVPAPAPRAVIFVEQRRFLEPVRPTTVIVNNTTIINKTVNVTKIKVVNKNTVINEGPRTTVIEQASGHKVRQEPVREVRRQHEATEVGKIHGKRNAPAVTTEQPSRPVTPPQRNAPEEPRARPEQQRILDEKAAADRQATEKAARDRKAVDDRARQEQHRAAEMEKKADAERRAQPERERKEPSVVEGQRDLERRPAVEHEQKQKAADERLRQERQRDEKQAAEAKRDADRRAAVEQEKRQKAEAQRIADSERQKMETPRRPEPAARDQQTAERRAAAQLEQEQKKAEKKAEQEQKHADKQEKKAEKHPGKKGDEEGTNAVQRTESRDK